MLTSKKFTSKSELVFPSVVLIADVGKDQSGFYHIGDEAMMLNTLKWYQHTFPHQKIGILSRSLSHQHLGVDEHLHLPMPYAVHWHHSPVYVVKFISKYLLSLLTNKSYFNPAEQSFIDFIEKYDVFHFTGGGNIYSHHPPWLYYVFLLIVLGRINHKKVLLTSQTIGPFQLRDKVATNFFLSLSSLITIREPAIQKKQFAGTFFKPVIHPCIDSAYTLSVYRTTLIPPKNKRCIRIGLSLHQWAKFGEMLQKTVTESLTLLAKSQAIELVLLPHILSQNQSEWDSGYLQQITAKLPKEIKVFAPTYQQIMSHGKHIHEPTETIKSLTSDLDLLIATRYHGLVFALSTDVPVVTFKMDDYYEQKNSNLLNMVYQYNWQRFIVDIANDAATIKLYKLLKQLISRITIEKKLLTRQNQKLRKDNTFYDLAKLRDDFLLPQRRTVDVIIVLAGGITDAGDVPENVKKRVQTAKKLFDQGVARYIVMSGRWSTFREKYPPIRTEAAAMKAYAEEIGIPSEAILKEEQSNNTETNILYTLKLILEPRKWKNCIVITSDFHLERTKYIFEHLTNRSYQIEYVPAKTNFSILKWWWLYFCEIILLLLTKRQKLTNKATLLNQF